MPKKRYHIRLANALAKKWRASGFSEVSTRAARAENFGGAGGVLSFFGLFLSAAFCFLISSGVSALVLGTSSGLPVRNISVAFLPTPFGDLKATAAGSFSARNWPAS